MRGGACGSGQSRPPCCEPRALVSQGHVPQAREAHGSASCYLEPEHPAWHTEVLVWTRRENIWHQNYSRKSGPRGPWSGERVVIQLAPWKNQREGPGEAVTPRRKPARVGGHGVGLGRWVPGLPLPRGFAKGSESGAANASGSQVPR